MSISPDRSMGSLTIRHYCKDGSFGLDEIPLETSAERTTISSTRMSGQGAIVSASVAAATTSRKLNPGSSALNPYAPSYPGRQFKTSRKQERSRAKSWFRALHAASTKDYSTELDGVDDFELNAVPTPVVTIDSHGNSNDSGVRGIWRNTEQLLDSASCVDLPVNSSDLPVIPVAGVSHVLSSPVMQRGTSPADNAEPTDASKTSAAAQSTPGMQDFVKIYNISLNGPQHNTSALLAMGNHAAGSHAPAGPFYGDSVNPRAQQHRLAPLRMAAMNWHRQPQRDAAYHQVLTENPRPMSLSDLDKFGYHTAVHAVTTELNFETWRSQLAIMIAGVWIVAEDNRHTLPRMHVEEAMHHTVATHSQHR